MKKLAAILATVMVAGTLMVACGSEEAVVEEVVTTEATVEATVEATEEATTVEATEEATTEVATTEEATTEAATEEATTEVATTEEPSSENDSTTKIVAATDVVNMRSSDSEIADKVGKAQIGDRFKLLEQRANGWSKVLADGQEVFIKSDYLEIVEETPAENTETEPQEAQAVNTSLGSDGYVTATTTVNVRAAANQTSEKLGKVYQGERLELIANQADGWCKIKYKGKTGYV